jgi:hypothetical protein
MDILGVEISGSLAEFYAEVEQRFAADGVAIYCARSDGPEFGGFYLEGERARVALRSDLPPDAFRHTLAHELVHGLQRHEGWPKAVANPDLGDDSAAEEVAAVLQAIVHCSAAELRIAPLGLDPSWEQGERHAGIRNLLRAPHRGADTYGTPAWAYWSLLYAYITLLHPAERSRTLLHNFERAIPLAAEAGREAAALVQRHGYATREQGLASLLAVHDAMALGPHVLVEDPREGAVHDGWPIVDAADEPSEEPVVGS